VTAPKRIVVVDDELHIRSLLGQILAPPDFEVHAFEDPRDALMKLHDLAPDLIVCDVMMPDMDGRTFLKVVKRSQDLRDVPFIFLSAVKETQEVVQAYEVGADDFVEKPFHVARLIAKVRAVLRLAERRRADALTGAVRGEGTLALLKFCEDNHLTGRLTVSARGQQRWAEFLGGEVVRAGTTPEEPDVDALDALLAMQDGAYRIEQRRLDRQAVEDALAQRRGDATAEAEAPAPHDDETEPTPHLPEGRLSRVVVRGQEVQVQTEASNRPLFTVTTILARDGQVLRKIESAWHHALKRREDVELARAQIERQHERVVATLRELGREAPRASEAGAEETVDPSLLAWALSFVSEQVRHHLGAVMAVALLRRTHRTLARENAVLRSFRVAEDGRVQVDGEPGPLPRAAVASLAAWTAEFIGAAAELVERVRALRLRTVTRMMEAELERVGFYAACEKAMERGAG
jgi:DNA-binding response OmpR family regulator